ncbi:hypothetical protein [Flavobacterium sp. GCM10027622]|uniref:hypothetical protein n=1 Tax=unclassified Flavobacterium TaxID=196869 RepID=UPI00360BA1F2
MTSEQFLNSFDDNCHKILNEEVYYLEDVKDNETNFVEQDDYWNLCIENKNSKKIILLENEFCVMKNENSKKCDWALFEADNLFFIESKDVKPRNRSKERKDATKQLISTIEFYGSKIDLTTLNLHALICFKSKAKIIKSGDQARKALFKETYNADYFEANLIEL